MRHIRTPAGIAAILVAGGFGRLEAQDGSARPQGSFAAGFYRQIGYAANTGLSFRAALVQQVRRRGPALEVHLGLLVPDAVCLVNGCDPRGPTLGTIGASVRWSLPATPVDFRIGAGLYGPVVNFFSQETRRTAFEVAARLPFSGEMIATYLEVSYVRLFNPTMGGSMVALTLGHVY